MPYSVPWITNRCRCLPLQPNTVRRMVCSSAIVAVVGTSRRRQISGLIPGQYHPQLIHGVRGGSRVRHRALLAPPVRGSANGRFTAKPDYPHTPATTGSRHVGNRDSAAVATTTVLDPTRRR